MSPNNISIQINNLILNTKRCVPKHFGASCYMTVPTNVEVRKPNTKSVYLQVVPTYLVVRKTCPR